MCYIAHKVNDILAYNLGKYQGKGWCLFTALIFSGELKRRKIQHKFVLGYMNERNQHSYLHCWIEIDGEIFDPSLSASSTYTDISYTIGTSYTDCGIYTLNTATYTIIPEIHTLNTATYTIIPAYIVEYSTSPLYYSLEENDNRYKLYNDTRIRFMRSPRKIWKHISHFYLYKHSCNLQAYINDCRKLLTEI